MVTYIFSDECIVFHVGKDEPFTLREAVNYACSSAGLSPWADIEAELFSKGDSSLIIVRPRPPRTRRLKDVRPRLYRI